MEEVLAKGGSIGFRATGDTFACHQTIEFVVEILPFMLQNAK